MNDTLDAHAEGRAANERGDFLTSCPYTATQPARAEQWMQGWDDAQIDREIWEDSNWHRACKFGEAA